MDENKLNSEIVTMQFTKGNAAVLAHSQKRTDDAPEGTPTLRWVFITDQIAEQNGLVLPDTTPEIFTALSVEDRDALAEKILDTLLEIHRKAGEDFSSALRDSAADPEETPSD